MAFDFGNLLPQYVGGLAAADPAQAERDFGTVAQHAPSSAMAQGITEALRSDQTPPFAQMVSQLFGRSDPTQRAGMLNQLLSHVSPAMLASLAGTIGNFLSQGSQPQVTPQQANAIIPAQLSALSVPPPPQSPAPPRPDATPSPHATRL
ncbi:hypothetical protein GCM10027277_29650 [Pseudoduganella ginsengisoli]|uniref:Uncharacterized protein n=1 Tax=Pseudoduganella ginsengisoli TaxID=1462440 RepID=A0A6L6Q0A6_9BURK|nr:hypothetical protein [Pseudoduganella ginsengisoli]MTW03065.1 hypothetical protein [Pseudoduganella ginsengisoli]